MAHISTTTDTQSVTVQQIDPRTLLVDKNVRTDARLDADFIASLTEHGVLSPIVAVRTSVGEVRVRMGHRRTLGSIQADLATVPVIVVADESTTKAGEVERLVQQYAENEHRTGLSTAERADTVAQLAAFGVSAAQIAKRTRMPRPQVDAALVAAKSAIAREGIADYSLTIEQAAVVAEFEDDQQTASDLIAAAMVGRFDHAAQRARDRRVERQEYATAAAPFQEAGLTVIEQPSYSDNTSALGTLTDDPDTREPLTVEGHATCPGHAAWLREDWVLAPTGDTPSPEDTATDDEAGDDQDDDEDCYDQDGADDADYVRVWKPVYVCTEPERHSPRYGTGRPAASEPVSDAESEEQQALLKEKARQERREVIDNNKAWRSAETVRREWLTGFLGRKTAPKGTGAFLAAALGSDGFVLADSQRRSLGYTLLGLDEPSWGKDTLSPVLTSATEGRAQVIALGLTLGAYEANTDIHHWRNKQASTERYLRFLASAGYTLSDVERRACGEDPLPEQVDAA